VLQAWAGREVTIMLDGCFIRPVALQMVRVSLSQSYRALVLAWEVVTEKGNVELKVCETMLDHVAKLMGRLRRITFLADRGFRNRAWARKCRELDWDYIIRIATNTIITFPRGVQRAADQLGVKPGQRREMPNVQVTLSADWTCNLASHLDTGDSELPGRTLRGDDQSAPEWLGVAPLSEAHLPSKGYLTD
jgi:hypothetical protein